MSNITWREVGLSRTMKAISTKDDETLLVDNLMVRIHETLHVIMKQTENRIPNVLTFTFIRRRQFGEFPSGDLRVEWPYDPKDIR